MPSEYTEKLETILGSNFTKIIEKGNVRNGME